MRVIEEWNNLPDATKEAANVGQFKRLYRRYRGLVAPAHGDQKMIGEQERATQQQYPHRGPNWTNEDYPTSIPSKNVEESQTLVHDDFVLL